MTAERDDRSAARAEAEGPLYQRLVGSLRSEIQAGLHPVGGLLPTESELQARFGVSRHTVREALRQLRDAGLVASRQGAGTTVLKPRAADQFVHEVATINDLVSHADELRYVIESTSMVTADAALAERLDGRAGTLWLRVEGYRHRPGEARPTAWTEVFIEAGYAGVALHLGRRPGPIFLWIEEMYGVTVTEVEQRLTARPAPDVILAPLEIAPGATVIEVKRTYHLKDGAVCVIAFNLYPADRFTHTMTLRRMKG